MERSVIASAAELIGRWDYPAARELLERALSGPAPGLDGLTARRLLAEVLRELGESGPAYRLAVEVAAECERRYGTEHPATVRALGVLATVCHDRGRLAEAERRYACIVTGRPDGPAGRWVLLARANLALLRRDRGEPGAALRELTLAYTLHRRRFGGADLDTVRLAAELGRLQAELGDLAAARRSMAVAHAHARGALGEEHPLTGAIEAALAQVEPAMPAAPADPGTVAPAVPPRPAGTRLRGWHRRHRRTGAAVLGAALVLGAAGLALTGQPPGQRPPAAAPAPDRSAAAAGGPRDVALHDEGSRITVTWTDPSAGRAGTLIAVARAGQPAGPLVALPAGTREYAFTGLDDTANYCVMLATAYPDERIARAEQTCTNRRPLVDVANG